MISSAAVDHPRGQSAPPDLGDASRYARLDRVPILDTMERTVARLDAYGEPCEATERLDERQLRVILRNTQARAARGEFGLITLGHSRADDPDADPPPAVGHLADFELGQHDGRPTILASMYLDLSEDPDAFLGQFPRRSAEIVGIEAPTGYIESVALLKRTPQRPLGLITHLNLIPIRHQNISRFECPRCEERQPMPAAPNKAAEIGRLQADNRRIKARLDESERRARRDRIESQVIRLEAEGVILDRAEEVTRLIRMPDNRIEPEISLMRKNYRRSAHSPVGAPMIPLGGGSGGNAVSRVPTVEELSAPRPGDQMGVSKEGQPIYIYGNEVVRLAMEEEEEGRPLVTASRTNTGTPPHLVRRANALKTARAAVKRFMMAKEEKTRV